MTTVQISLPDALAQKAARAGLLAPERIAHILREQLSAARLERLKQVRETLATDPLPPMTTEEIQAEIDAYRTEQRRAAAAAAGADLIVSGDAHLLDEGRFRGIEIFTAAAAVARIMGTNQQEAPDV